MDGAESPLDPPAPSMVPAKGEGPGVAFIDVEATGLGPYSWPIEVGWAFHGHEPRSVLIRPAEAWSMQAWEKPAESLHRIDPSLLLTEGRAAREVALGLNAALGQSDVYSDAPDYDSFWLFRLYDAAGIRPNYRLRDLGELLGPLWQQAPRDLVRRAAAVAPRTHRAADDVRHLQTMYEIALRERGEGATG
ncbi:hypothetical protein [Parvularcula dongshanensis]|uniref:Exonuclease domain-containing protein n=1 Tax=Parvularcula dongshanensis TaxID=1173995 RepID=A0A840I5F8_9PROT|nr:hypothetical protein [Parvularcula dongshanensis]MBB4660027.1 hypothetical protein [Parvularcula dongshanensis]